MKWRRVLAAWTVLMAVATTRDAFAQAVTGLELALHGHAHALAGRPLHLRGVAYEVVGLATLRPAPRAHVTVTLPLDVADDPASGHTPPVTATVTADEQGRFTLDLPLPEVVPPTRTLTVVLETGGRTRAFAEPVQVGTRYVLEALTDRRLYEPGETVHVWARLLDGASGAPVGGRRVTIEVGDANAGGPWRRAEIATSAAGVASLDVPVASTSASQRVPVVVALPSLGLASHDAVAIGLRTVDRLRADVVLDAHLVAPGMPVHATVTVRAPSGAPVRDAHVTVQSGTSQARLVVTAPPTDARGQTTVALDAPAYATEATSFESVTVVALHPGYGRAEAATSLVIARSPWTADVVAQGAGLVPGAHAIAYLSLTDPLGELPPAGLAVTVTGVAVDAAHGRFQGATDRHGLVAVPMRAHAGDAAPHADGTCGTGAVTSIDVATTRGAPFHARLCVPVATQSTVAVRAVQPALRPGEPLAFTIERVGAAAGREVTVDAIGTVDATHGPVSIASITVAAATDREQMTLPPRWLGIVKVCARPVLHGATDEGTGSCDAVLVRPAGTFDASIEPERPAYRPGETARLVVHTPAGRDDVTVAFLARDASSLAGERAFEASWLRGAIDHAVLDPSTPDAERLVRVALTGFLGIDPQPVGSPPVASGTEAETGYDDAAAAQRGDLRDPYALRDECIRRGLGAAMTALETALGSDDRDTVRAGRAFAPDAIAHLVDAGSLDAAAARTLGDGELTVAMLLGAPEVGFTFDRAARRAARRQLVQLLVRVAGYVDPVDSTRSSPVAGQSPARWLSQMVQHGVLAAGDLRDPWGHAFVLRAAGARRASIVLSPRASDQELVSPGPDGIAGNDDDVRDPFERVVPAHTVYAVTSGEDALMAALAALDPGEDVLTRLAAAYHRQSDAAREELVGDAATSGDRDVRGFGGLGGSGTGYGGGGGYGAALGSTAYAMGEGRAGSGSRGLATRLAARIRERFPATLRFVAGQAAAASGITYFDLPLADALTTYRVEIIAWGRDGWTTSASTEVHVDQDALVDAPVPPEATVGDVIRLPLRLANRSSSPLDARIALQASPGLALSLPAPVRVRVGAGDSVEAVVTLAPGAVGEGTLTVVATDAISGRALDAVRRPMRVQTGGRAVRMDALDVAEGGADLSLRLPGDAHAMAPVVTRLVAGGALFGASRAWQQRAADATLPAWALAIGHEPLDAQLVDRVAAILRIPAAADRASREPAHPEAAVLARSIGALWNVASVDDATLAHALESLARALPDPSRDVPTATEVLLGLAAAHRATSRPDLAPTLRASVRQLRGVVERAAAASGDDPVTQACMAAALQLASDEGAGGSTRAHELVRRASRARVQTSRGDVLEDSDGSASDAAPTVALALAADGARRDALALLAAMARGPSLGDRGRALALAALERAVPSTRGSDRARVGVVVDGVASTVVLEDGVGEIAAPTRTVAGVHRVSVRAPGVVLLVRGRARYDRDWNAPTVSRASFEITREGSVGAREQRASLVLRVRNRGPRVAVASQLEIELPAGAELDVPARREIARRAGHTPSVDGRTLRVTLRALAPGAQIRVPLPLHWTVGGRLRGLGAAVYNSDALGAAASVLPPVTVDVADAAQP